MSYRLHYPKTLQELYIEELSGRSEGQAIRSAKRRLRMYANLFCRDVRKQKNISVEKCINCNSSQNLQIDHIIPITKGGRNEINNTQVLCRKCNRLKSNKV